MHFGLDFSMVGGSSSSGAFDPSKSDPLAVWDFSPNTVFQDVNGTIPATEHGDPVGLVLDRSQGLVRGSELTPTFTGFSEPTGVTVTPSSLTFASATDVQSGRSGLVVSGLSYDVSFTVSGLSGGTLRLRFGSSGLNDLDITADGDYQLTGIEADGVTIAFRMSGTGSAVVTNLSTREIPGNHLRQPTANARPTLEIELGNGRGPEQVVNGTFDENVNDWIAFSTTVSWVAGGFMRVTGSGGSRGAYQAFTTEIGKTYEVIARSEVASISHLVRVGDGGTPDAGIADSASSSVPATLSVTFVAQSTQSYVYLRNGASGTVEWDNVSVREVLRDGPRGLRFDGVDDWLDATGLTAATGPKTVIAGVITEDGELNDRQFLLDSETGRQISAAVGPTSGTAAMFDGNWSGPANYDAEALSVITFKHWATGGGIRVDGADVTSENQTERAFGGSVAVGSQFAGSFDFLNGVIYALLPYARVLTDAEITQNEDWVALQTGKVL